jgi:hypothetical protein
MADATVTVGPIETDDTFGEYDLNAQADGIFGDYEINNYYESDKHVYMMGVTSPGGNPSGGTVAFCQLAMPTLLWLCDWTALKWGEKPNIPDPNRLADPGWVLMDEHYATAKIDATVEADADAVLYRISGLFLYGHRNPDQIVLHHVRFGRPPYLNDFVTRSISEEFFTANLIDSVD